MTSPRHRLSIVTPPARPGERIGLFGGSFDPPHEAHRVNSTIARQKLALDRVWWIVTPGNPLKAGRQPAPLGNRIRMARDLADARWIEVTGFEAALGSAYTADTLAFLVARYPQTRFVWLMGADNLAGFHRWQRWRDIARMMPIAVLDRPGWRYRAIAGPAGRSLAQHRIDEREGRRLPALSTPAWTYLSRPLSHLSSTALRAAAAPPQSGPGRAWKAP
jgi:nicotinate-nucleotide adenylyltransferase